jgi:ABC-type polysaccharide/polyol phosphate export permease
LNAALDIKQALLCWRIIFYMAMSDLKARYKRTALGPLWITLGSAVGIGGLGFVWSEIMKIDRATFVPMLTVGLIFWQFIAGSITESTSLFYRQSALIRNLQLPISLYLFQQYCRNVLNLLHNLPVIIFVFLILGHSWNLNQLYVFPSFVLASLNLLWMMLLIGMVGARFRDLEQMIAMIFPLLMFFSPVFFKPSALGAMAKFIWLNPFSYLIEVVREPLLGNAPNIKVVFVCVLMAIIGWFFSLWMFNKKLHRIAFWV